MTPEDYWEMQWGKLSVRNRVLEQENARLRSAIEDFEANLTRLKELCGMWDEINETSVDWWQVEMDKALEVGDE